MDKIKHGYIEDVIRDETENGRISGAAVRAIHKGEIIYDECFGYADKENAVPITPDTIYRMFSMSKPVTAAAALQLVERGKLMLTWPLQWFIPSFSDMKIAGSGKSASRDVTIRDLLTMTSGISYPGDMNESQKGAGELFWKIKEGNAGRMKPLTTKEVASELGKYPLAFDPGEMWDYGTSADVMGAVIEQISGMEYGEYLRKNIFEPLGMEDTGFFIPEEKYHRLAQIYEMTEKGLVPFTDLHLGLTDYRTKPSFESGGAGLVSTIGDYSKFASALLDDNETILGRKTKEMFGRDMLTDAQRKSLCWDSLKGHSYGCFCRVLLDKTVIGLGSSEGEFGWDGWTGNYFSVDRKEDLVYLYFIQRAGAGTTDACLRIKNIIYSDIV